MELARGVQEAIIQRHDANRDGRLSYDEFVQLVRCSLMHAHITLAIWRFRGCLGPLEL